VATLLERTSAVPAALRCAATRNLGAGARLVLEYGVEGRRADQVPGGGARGGGYPDGKPQGGDAGEGPTTGMRRKPVICICRIKEAPMASSVCARHWCASTTSVLLKLKRRSWLKSL
jgi:hypothetical protein